MAEDTEASLRPRWRQELEVVLSAECFPAGSDDLTAILLRKHAPSHLLWRLSVLPRAREFGSLTELFAFLEQAQPPSSGDRSPSGTRGGRAPGPDAADTGGEARVGHRSLHTDELAALLQGRGWSVAVAESLTAGAIASALGRAPHASTWFLGGVVAYAPRTKFDVLGAPPGPVVSPTVACAMTDSVADLFGSDLTLAATGVGGPGPESGTAAGTVWFAVRRLDRVQTHLFHFQGTPERVIARTVDEAVRLLIRMSRCDVDVNGHPTQTIGSRPLRDRAYRPVSAPVAGDLGTTPTWSTKGVEGN